MRISSVAVDVLVALLAASSVAGLVPNSYGTNAKLMQNEILPTSPTVLFSSRSSESGSSPAFPFTDTQVRFAYDEWRLIYGKGNFDLVRFEQFKRNHRTLVLSNLKAREKAAQDGRPMPQWMSLNEYGDYSMEEYEAMLRGEKPVVKKNSNMAYSSSSSDAGEQSVRATQQVLPQQGRATMRMHDDYAKNYKNGQVLEYQDQYGRPIRSTQALQQGETLVRTASPQSSIAPNINSNYANNIDQEIERSSGKRGTLIIPKEEENDSQRGTQVISSSSAPRGTQVISSSSAPRELQAIGSSSAVRGTQVINSSSPVNGMPPINASPSVRGTQVIKPVNGASPAPYGTQAVAKSTNGSTNGSYGTQVIRKSGGGNDAPKSYGTQVISSSNNGEPSVRGTQVIQRVSGAGDNAKQSVDEGPSGTGNRGTLIIPKGAKDEQSSDSNDEGTIRIRKEDKESWGDILGKIFEDSEKKESENEDDDEVGKRGTLVIKRSIELPEAKKNPFSFFGSGGTEKEEKSEVAEEPTQEEKPSGINSFFNFGSSETQKEKEVEVDVDVDEEPTQEEKPSGGNSFFNFGSSDKKKEPEVEAEEEPTPEEKPSGGNSFFNFGSSGKKQEPEVAAEEEPTPEEKPPGGFFNFFAPKDDTVKNEIAEDIASVVEEKADTESDDKAGSNIFSFFGGSVKKANPRPVRTTITLQQDAADAKKAPDTKTKRKTKLIPEKENENGMPSILSFFGGAKKVTSEESARDPNSRPTLIVNKPKKTSGWSPFSTKKKDDEASKKAPAPPKNVKDDVTAKRIARQKEGVERAAKRKAEVAKEREQRRLDLEQKRLEATRRREAQAKERAAKTSQSATPASTKPKSNSPFQFIGAIGKQGTPPTLKKWRQNRDGTITGLIYDSKNFKDGTRITTSPIPKGATSGSVVKTAGGSKYNLV